ncbi:hypothetical protein ACL02S_05585 [Nocardia sp. 004]|uniref:hypothetical protein n=1 Tax=Nocardia sp. 004 TaxID=3385978 RepID=UPI0039A046DD
MRIRKWYDAQAASIPELDKEGLARGLSTEERARRAQGIRHDARMTARAMDPDRIRVRELRKRDYKLYGNPDGPAFDDLVEKYRNRGLSDDEVFETIIGSSNRTNAEVNQQLGVTRESEANNRSRPSYPPGGASAKAAGSPRKQPGAGPGTPHRDQMKKPGWLGNLTGRLKNAPSAAAGKFKNLPGKAGQAAGGTAALLGGAEAAAGMLPELSAAMSNPMGATGQLLGEVSGMAGLLDNTGGGQVAASPAGGGRGGSPAAGKAAKSKGGGAAKASAEAAKKSTEAMKKSTEAMKKSTEAAKKSTEAVKKSTEGFKKFSGELKKSAKAHKSASSATKSMTGAQKNLNKAMRANPLGMVVTVITTAIGVIGLLVDNWDKVKVAFEWVHKNVLIPVGKWFSDTWSGTVVPMFKTSIDTVSGFFSGMGETVQGVWNGIVGTIQGVVRTIADLVGSIPLPVTQNIAASLNNFLGPEKKADGGMLRGPGGPRDDVIPVLASNGEYIVNAESTAKNLPLLEAINSGATPKFADGGRVAHSSFSDWAGQSATDAVSGFFFGPEGKPEPEYDEDKPRTPEQAREDAVNGMFDGFSNAAGIFASGMVGSVMSELNISRVPPLVQGLVKAGIAIDEHREQEKDRAERKAQADAEKAQAAAENATGDGQTEAETDAETTPENEKGLSEKAATLIDLAKRVEGAPYDPGGMHWGDCSGAVSALANFAAGLPPFGSRFATANQPGALADRGARHGLGPAGSLNIGWYHRGGEDGHTAATLPNGVNFEMGGRRGNGQYGGFAAGADDPVFTDHAHFPPEMFLAAGGSVSGAGSSIGDLIPAWLSDGEFVVNARSADANRSLLHAINQDASALSTLVQPTPVPTRALVGAGVGGESLDQSTTIHLSTPDVDTAFQKAKTWEAQRALTYTSRWG